MAKTDTGSKRLNFEINSSAFAVLVLGVCLGSISLTLISARLGPISRQASIWNDCVDTTQTFLSGLQSFYDTEPKELNAMSVNLCNGSTPQKVEQ